MKPTREQILELFTVDLVTGKLFWKAPGKGRNRPDLEAGFSKRTGPNEHYWYIALDRRHYKRSHIIFLVVHGRYPTPCADHIDGNSINDRPENIREVTNKQNSWNRNKRFRLRNDLPMGVRQLKSGNYETRLGFNGRQMSLGSYGTVEEAQAVYLQKRRELYGEFARTGE